MPLNNLFKHVATRTPYTCKQALPRTVAPLLAGMGAFAGALHGGGAALFLGCFPDHKGQSLILDGKKVDPFALITLVGGGALLGAAIVGGKIYLTSYFATNLFMCGFRTFENVESRLLARPGFKDQAVLFGTGFALPSLFWAAKNIPTMLAQNASNNNSDSSPKP